MQKAPFSRDYGPDFPRQWATTAPVLPRKTRVLATMLWNGVDGIRGFPRSLAWDLHAGEGFNAAGHGRGRSPAREIARHRRVNSGRREKARGTRLRPLARTTPWQAADGVPPRGRRKQGRLRDPSIRPDRSGLAQGRLRDPDESGRAPAGGREPDAGASAEQPFQQFVAVQCGVGGDVAQDAAQGPDFQGIVVGNREVMLAALAGAGQAYVTARLARDTIAESPKGLDQPFSGNVSREPQRAKTSSRTKWILTSLGRSAGSS